MNTDIRIQVSFRGHRKRLRLKALLGQDATGFLLDLWISVALDRPNGALVGLDDLDIALMAGWSGDPAVFVKALVDAGFLDATGDGHYALHDWVEHNGWASDAAARSERSKKASRARWDRELGREFADAESEGDAPAMPKQSPSIPRANLQANTVVALYNDLLGVSPPGLPRVTSVSDRLRQAISARIREKASRDDVDWWRNYFTDVAKSDFLCGRINEFSANLHWLVGPKNMDKVLNGYYVNKTRTSPPSGSGPAAKKSPMRRHLDSVKGGAGNGSTDVDSEVLGGRDGLVDGDKAGALELTQDADGRYSK